MRHDLKSHPEFFAASWAGSKTFEIRYNDRKFHVGDQVLLLEFDPIKREYSGREIDGLIRYMTAFEQKPGYVVFSFDETARRGNEK